MLHQVLPFPQSDTASAISEMLARNPLSPFSLAPPWNVLAIRNQLNTLIDCRYYNLRVLSDAEETFLMGEYHQEGSILVVEPAGQHQDVRILKFEDFESFRNAGGPLLQRFAIAGVGSSDIGAAAFARQVANRYQTPVGAIVAGNGLSDVLPEALGGWLVLGNLVRSFALIERFSGTFFVERNLLELATRSEATPIAYRSDTQTLLRLLAEPERKVLSITGHSKGALSIAYALWELHYSGKHDLLHHISDIRITTAGAVVPLPGEFRNVGQYLGSLDSLGALNSDLSVAFKSIYGAGHHLNTDFGLAMDFDSILAKEPD